MPRLQIFRQIGTPIEVICRKIHLLAFLAFFCLLGTLFSCEEGPAGLQKRDIRPPRLVAQKSLEKSFQFKFNEALGKAEFTSIKPPMPLDKLEVEHSVLSIIFNQNMVPGSPYLLRAKVYDADNNILNFLVRIYGANTTPAKLLINEFNPEGSNSTNSPEVVEFYVVRGGNVGGLTFTVGTLEENKGRFVFPSLTVSTGDYILLHTRWDSSHKKDITRANEVSSKSEADARLSSDDAWDFWSDEISGGLSGTNSALTLYKNPQNKGQVMDAVIYSTSATAKKYRGWKTSFLLRQVDRLAKLKAWRGKASDLVPEDAIRSKDSSGTRSLSRKHKSGKPIDSDRAADWIIVPTKKYSFGSVNTQTEYAP